MNIEHIARHDVVPDEVELSLPVTCRKKSVLFIDHRKGNMMSEKSIPIFASVKEEAEFWDTHDITDYLGELEIAEGVYTPKLGEKKAVMTIRIASSLKEQVDMVAQSYDISSSSLLRMWIVDKLRAYQHGR